MLTWVLGEESARGQYLENYYRYANKIFTGWWYGKTEYNCDVIIIVTSLWRNRSENYGYEAVQKRFFSGLFFAVVLTYIIISINRFILVDMFLFFLSIFIFIEIQCAKIWNLFCVLTFRVLAKKLTFFLKRLFLVSFLLILVPPSGILTEIKSIVIIILNKPFTIWKIFL